MRENLERDEKDDRAPLPPAILEFRGRELEEQVQ
jgi:hypothetical protein